MTTPVYRLAVASLGTTGLGTPIGGLTNILETIGVREGSRLFWTEALNGYGSIEFELPIDHASVTRANFAVGARELHLYRDEVLVWGGKLWVADVQDWFVRFIGYSWYYDLIQKRDVEEDYASLPTAPKDQYKIVAELLRLTQGIDTGWNDTGGSAGRDLGITQFVDYLTTASGITRNLTVCSEERRKIGDVIEEMAAARDGFDFEISPAKIFRMWTPRRGTVLGTPAFNTSDNTTDLTYQEDATDITTQAVGVGDVEDCAVPAVYITTDAGAVTTYGLQHGEPQSGDDSRDNQAMIQKIADEHLWSHKVPRFQPSTEYLQALQDIASVPIGFTSYAIGDWMTLTSTRGATGGFGFVSVTMRVMGREIRFSADGESVTPQLEAYPS